MVQSNNDFTSVWTVSKPSNFPNDNAFDLATGPRGEGLKVTNIEIKLSWTPSAPRKTNQRPNENVESIKKLKKNAKVAVINEEVNVPVKIASKGSKKKSRLKISKKRLRSTKT